MHHSEWPLSDFGQEQARRLAGVLADLGLDRMFSSPFRRCLQTIQPFIERTGLDLEVHDDLREHLITPTLIDDFLDLWHRSWDDFDFALDGCESSRRAQGRMVTAVTKICSTTDARRIGVSSHGNVISLLANHADSRFGREQAERLRNPEIVRILWKDGTFQLDSAYTCTPLKAFATKPRRGANASTDNRG